MKVKAEVNMPKMRHKLNKLSKEFGDTHDQAVSRLAVSVARNLAFETESWGKVGAKKKQEEAIMRGITNVVEIVDAKKMKWMQNQSKMLVITDPLVLSKHVDSLRNKDGMTPRISADQRAITTEAVVKKCFTIRRKLSGMAKGGWLGAGIKASQMQTGGDRLTIGKNFLGYAQKFTDFGRAIMRGGTLRSKFIVLKNTVKHSGKKRVLSAGKIARAKDQASVSTVKWYGTAIRKRKKALTV
jgi:hypothetical protein